MKEALKIMIVDDSVFILERIINFIAEINEVKITGICRSADEAFEYLSGEIPDLAIIDIRLKDSSGIDVLNHIKNKQLKTVTIMMTNYPSEQYKQACIDLGADYFLEKSFEFFKIQDIILKMIAKKTLR